MAIRVGSKKDSYGRLSSYYNLKDADRLPKYLSNYFGDGSDQDLHVTSDLQLTSTQDGDMVVKNYKNLTLDDGVTLTVANRCRGLLIFVDGDLTGPSSGMAYIDMTAKGCHANPADSGVTSDTPVAPSDGNAVHTDGIQIPFLTASGSDALTAHLEGCGTDAYALNTAYAELVGKNGRLITIPRVGADGADDAPQSTAGDNGDAGTNGQSGGGGAGGAGDATYYTRGAAGTCFSGGAGGGGSTAAVSDAAQAYGGQGGDAYNTNNGAGAGNPHGDNDYGSAEEGTGGALFVVVSGNVTGNITIRSNGKNGGDSVDGSGGVSAGGGSGGGVVVLAHRGASSAILTASGGVGGTAYVTPASGGGDGGAGSIIEIGDLI